MTPPQYLLFTSLVKHGKLLRYLLAAQVRKRLMEPYGFHRQVKSSALTGNPDRVFELYYVEEPGQAIADLEELSKDPIFRESHALTEDARITSAMSPPLLEIPPPLQKLSGVDYLFERKSRQARSKSFAEAPSLLQVTCTLHTNDTLPQFNDCMKALLKVFEDSGLTLLVAGQHAGRIELDPEKKEPVVEVEPGCEDPISILNVWQFEDPDSPKLLMLQLADNQRYSELDALCTQDQHICRNVSRHYQRYPLLPGIPLTL